MKVYIYPSFIDQKTPNDSLLLAIWDQINEKFKRKSLKDCKYAPEFEFKTKNNFKKFVDFNKLKDTVFNEIKNN
jgi:hypothetical protein